MPKAILPPGVFRIVLAVMVVVSHLTRFDIGRLAVLLFFVLSGYWTAKIWEAKFGAGKLGWFYLARWLRIVPLYLVLLVAAAWARGIEPSLTNFALFGVASTDTDPLGVSWSLDIELQFYVLLPLIVLVARRAPVIAVGLSLVASAAAWILLADSDVRLVAHYLPAFMAGVLIHVIAWKPADRTAQVSLLAFGLLSIAVMLSPLGDKRAPDAFNGDIVGFVWMLPLLPYVAASLQIRSGAIDRHLGNLSYPLYLVHFPVIALLPSTVGGKLLALFLTSVITLLVYFAVDRPLDRWRVRATEGNRADRSG